ncbi:MAG: hypothetical protein FJ125_01605 [Deltaproteobacteria bacterium]|nr:hypothetical protein [Deltaproteobacteria bacterium]
MSTERLICPRCGYPALLPQERTCPNDDAHLVPESEQRKDPHDPFLGRTLGGGRYPLLGIIGDDGADRLYRSLQPVTEREVAVQVLTAPDQSTPSREVQQRFLREARSQARIQHPAVATLYDFGTEQDGTMFLVLELVRGQQLACALAEGRLSLAELCEITLDVLDALDAAHRQGVIHRDLRPESIVLLPEEQRSARGIRARLLGFGLGRLLATSGSTGPGSPSSQGQSWGRGQGHRPALLEPRLAAATPSPFLAPEQMAGQTSDRRSNIWSVSAILFASCCGHPPGEAEVAALREGWAGGAAPAAPPGFPALPPALRTLLARGLAPEPQDRFAQARDMARALARATEIIGAPAADRALAGPGTAAGPFPASPGAGLPLPGEPAGATWLDIGAEAGGDTLLDLDRLAPGGPGEAAVVTAPATPGRPATLLRGQIRVRRVGRRHGGEHSPPGLAGGEAQGLSGGSLGRFFAFSEEHGFEKLEGEALEEVVDALRRPPGSRDAELAAELDDRPCIDLVDAVDEVDAAPAGQDEAAPAQPPPTSTTRPGELAAAAEPYWSRPISGQRAPTYRRSAVPLETVEAPASAVDDAADGAADDATDDAPDGTDDGATDGAAPPTGEDGGARLTTATPELTLSWTPLWQPSGSTEQAGARGSAPGTEPGPAREGERDHAVRAGAPGPAAALAEAARRPYADRASAMHMGGHRAATPGDQPLHAQALPQPGYPAARQPGATAQTAGLAGAVQAPSAATGRSPIPPAGRVASVESEQGGGARSRLAILLILLAIPAVLAFGALAYLLGGMQEQSAPAADGEEQQTGTGRAEAADRGRRESFRPGAMVHQEAAALLAEAEARQQLGQLAQAKVLLEEALDLNPDLTPAHHRLGLTLLQLGQPIPAELHLRQAMQASPDPLLSGYGLAQALLAQGRDLEAEEILLMLEKKLDAAPERRREVHDFYLVLGKLLLRRGSPEQALARLVLALGPQERRAEPWCLAGEALYLLNQHGKAVDFYQQAALVDPASPEAYHGLARSYLLQDPPEREKATTAFRKAIALDGQNRFPEARKGLGFLYRDQGKRADAVQMLRSYLGMIPPDARDRLEILREIASLEGRPLGSFSPME